MVSSPRRPASHSRLALLLVATLLALAGCNDRDTSYKVGIAIGNPTVSYPVVATIVKSASGSEMFLLNLEDGSVRLRRPSQRNPNSITGLASEKGLFLLTAYGASGADYAVAKYDFFMDREEIAWKTDKPVRLPFQLGDKTCAWHPGKYSPKGQALELSPICAETAYPSTAVPGLDQVVITNNRTTFLFDMSDDSVAYDLIAEDGAPELRQARLPIELFVYGFAYGERIFFSGSNTDKRVFELTREGLVDRASAIEDRLARSFESETDQVLFMNDEVTVLVSADYSNLSVTFSLVDTSGKMIRQHVLDLSD